MSSLRPDYEREYPTVRQQEVFFWHYLLRYDPSRAQRFSSSYERRKRIPQQTNHTNNNHHNVDDCTPTMMAQDDNHDEDDEWEVFLSTCSKEVGRFSLLSHLGWAIWSMVKLQETEGVDFDYMAYARHRMDGYVWAKNKFIQ